MKLVKSFIATVVCGVIAFSIPVHAAKEGTEKAKPAAAASQAEKDTDCHAMAKVFDTTICREQLNLGEFDKKRAEGPNGKADPRQIAQVTAALRNAIWQNALIHKFGDAAAPPTMEEVDTFRKGFDQTMDSSYEADKKTVDFIQSLLDKYSYTPNNEQKLRQLLDITQASLKLYSERQQHTQTMPKEYQFVVDTAERAIARNMLTTWKDDKILYNTYHGQLALLPGSVVPIDAYREFLKYIKDEGKLTILDPQYANVMEDLEKQVSQKHDSLPASDDIAAKYFTTPDWQFTLANSSSRFNELKAHLESIPNLGPKPGAQVDESELIGKQSHPGSALPAPAAGSPNQNQDGKDSAKP
ncbi:MAG TPA: hypothetical protein VL625_12510 [Patescibacteria group bacterium]|nr:hypothetical protein [Patescibacteria group bacterium]